MPPYVFMIGPAFPYTQAPAKCSEPGCQRTATYMSGKPMRAEPAPYIEWRCSLYCYHHFVQVKRGAPAPR